MTTLVLLRAITWFWLLAALYVGHTRQLATASPWAIPAVVVALATLVALGGVQVPILRDWMKQLPLRALLVLNVGRFAGFYLLHLAGQGVLPMQFAFAVGWSECIIAGVAAVLCVAPLRASWRDRALAIWNVVGFVGMLFFTYNLTRLTLADADLQSLFGELPLSLFPTFLMPMALATHIVLHVRLQAESAPAKPSEPRR